MDRQKLEEILELVASKDIIVSHAADRIISGIEQSRAEEIRSTVPKKKRKKTAPKRPIPDEDVAL